MSSERRALRVALQRSHARMLTLFRAWDDECKGVVGLGDFRRALPALGLHVEKPTVDGLYYELADPATGMLEYAQLASILRHGRPDAEPPAPCGGPPRPPFW